MSKPTMGHSKIGYTNNVVRQYRSWNPFGMGCSGGCDGCWARALAKRMAGKCADCAAFRPHIHLERLGQPGRTKQPRHVLCNFTNDWMDPAIGREYVADILATTRLVSAHTYITLTKRPERLVAFDPLPAPNIYHGLTIRNQEEADAKLPAFLRVPGHLWISYEPAAGAVRWDAAFYADTREPGSVRGIIVGHDNRSGAPGTEKLDHIRSAVEQCDAAGVNVYVKQLWAGGNLLRASHQDEYARFPEDLKRRDLPWAQEQP